MTGRLIPFVLVALFLVPGLRAVDPPSICFSQTSTPCACLPPATASNQEPQCFNPNTKQFSCPANSGDPTSGLKNPATSDNTRAICPAGFVYSKGDPLIKGFDGCTWYLKGQAGSVMNLITEANHVVNTLLVPANLTDEHHGGEGTFHGSISVRFQDTLVTSSVDAQGNLTVLLDDEPIPFETTRERHGLTVKAAEHFPYFGQVAEIVTPAFRFFIHAVQPYDSPAGWSRGHLDFSATTMAAPLSMHGLIGQGSNEAGELCVEDFNFHGEGEESDYVLAHLDSFDYTYSQFKKQKVSRRLQEASGVNFQPIFVKLIAGSAHLT